MLIDKEKDLAFEEKVAGLEWKRLSDKEKLFQIFDELQYYAAYGFTGNGTEDAQRIANKIKSVYDNML